MASVLRPILRLIELRRYVAPMEPSVSFWPILTINTKLLRSLFYL